MTPRSSSRSAITVLGLIGAACGSTDAVSDQGGEPLEASGATLVVGAEIVTMADEGGPDRAEALVIGSDGRIVAVGDRDEVADTAGPDARVIEFDGGLVLPGFQDAHLHVPEAGLNLDVCPLDPGLDLKDYEDLLAECAAETDGEWVTAAGATLFGLRTTSESPLDVIDRVIPDRPAVVLDDLGHAAWTNSLGLAAAGVTEDDRDPPGGTLHRDDSGRLTGLLLRG